MKERLILFCGSMVRALLDGSKTQTRHVVRDQATLDVAYSPIVNGGVVFNYSGTDRLMQCPHGQPGDRLSARETWAIKCLGRIGTPEGYDCSYELEYRADGATRAFDCPPGTDDSAYLRAYDRMRGDWWPSIHMPRWASRIMLEVTGVRVERLQDISEQDAIAEGIGKTASGFWSTYGRSGVDGTYSPRSSFHSLWESINGDGSWDANPWVWVVEFKRVTAETIRAAREAIEQ